MNNQLASARIALLSSRLATARTRSRGINLHRDEVALAVAILQWLQDDERGQAVATFVEEQDNDK